jgi:hypothetical protein
MRQLASAFPGTFPELSRYFRARVAQCVACGRNGRNQMENPIGIKSVETYKLRGTEKLGLKTRADIVRYASAQGWLAEI